MADRSVPLGGGRTGRPWSTARWGPYRLTAGRAPRAAGEVVVPGRWAVPGDRVVLAGRPRTVVGTVSEPLGVEDPVFFTDAEAARLAPRIDNVVVAAPVAAVRDVAARFPGTQVLTGDARRLADPDPDRDREALVSVNALVGTAAGVTGFVSVFVVASTFAFAVAQRRREFGLLRTAGATPRQIRRMVCGEALVVGVPASAAGCVLGGYGAPWLAAWLVDSGVAPAWFTIGPHNWPYAVAFPAGLLVALAGVWAASRRAGKVAPMEALRDAAVDSRAMTPGRWLCGAALLLAGIGLTVWRPAADPSEALHRKTYTTQPMLLIIAFALLAPVLVRPLTRMLTWLPARLPGATGMLVRENAAAGVRRTAAVAAPVLVTVALAGSLLGTTATLDRARATEARTQSGAAYVLTPEDGATFDARTVARARAVPGTETAVLASTAVYTLEDGVALIEDSAHAADPAELAAVERLPVAAGSVAELDDRGIVVTEEWRQHTVGRTVDVWLGDGRRATLRIAAVLRTGTGGNGSYVTPRNSGGAAPDRIDVALRPGACPARVAADLRAAVRPEGGRVQVQMRTKSPWATATSGGDNRQTRIGHLLVLGIALLYTGIALANTLVMATADRRRDLAVLRLAGATRRQVLRVVAAEALAVVAVGTALGAVVTALNLLGVQAALAALSVRSPVVVPWGTLGGCVAACALLAVTAAVLPAGFAVRRGPLDLTSLCE